MEIKKVTKYIGPIFIIFLVSYGLLFYKTFSLKTVKCRLTWKDDMYQREETIQVKYKKKTVHKLIYQETFSSDSEDIIALKKDEYIKEGYEVRSHKKELVARKEEAPQKAYKEVIGKLTEEGYTCK